MLHRNQARGHHHASAAPIVIKCVGTIAAAGPSAIKRVGTIAKAQVPSSSSTWGLSRKCSSHRHLARGLHRTSATLRHHSGGEEMFHRHQVRGDHRATVGRIVIKRVGTIVQSGPTKCHQARRYPCSVQVEAPPCMHVNKSWIVLFIS